MYRSHRRAQDVFFRTSDLVGRFAVPAKVRLALIWCLCRNHPGTGKWTWHQLWTCEPAPAGKGMAFGESIESPHRSVANPIAGSNPGPFRPENTLRYFLAALWRVFHPTPCQTSKIMRPRVRRPPPHPKANPTSPGVARAYTHL